jgi:hypothetical protein
MLLHLSQRNIDENIHMFTLYKEKIEFHCTNVMIYPIFVPKFLIYTMSKCIKQMTKNLYHTHMIRNLYHTHMIRYLFLVNQKNLVKHGGRTTC